MLFRSLWAYCGLALQTRASGEYRFSGGELQAAKKSPALRGLNVNHNHDLKNLFKGAAMHVSISTDPLGDFYRNLLTIRNEAADGASDIGPEDGGDRFNSLEEGSTLRSTRTETASSLSVW